jgi:hypothetical protein
MMVRPAIVLTLAALAISTAVPARADPREVLRNCQALLERADKSGAEKPSEADIARCRQVVRDWTLRDSRMLVDEQGRPLR